jgi:hypothetical protein
MRTLDCCLICHKGKLQQHHSIKRRWWKKLKMEEGEYPDSLIFPLCPKHHKEADLGKIEFCELYKLRKLGENAEQIIFEERENQPWETEWRQWDQRSQWFQWDPFVNVDNRTEHQKKRAERIETWLDSSHYVGTYLVENQMFSYIKPEMRMHTLIGYEKVYPYVNWRSFTNHAARPRAIIRERAAHPKVSSGANRRGSTQPLWIEDYQARINMRRYERLRKGS